MSNKVVLITGATDGLGKHLAQDFAEEGAILLLHGRNNKKGQKVIQQIKKATGNKNLSYYNADFASLDEIKQLAQKINKEHDRLDLLINNAGIGFGKPGSGRQLSKDGHELRFQVNYLAGFISTLRLLDLLRQSTPARVVNVASIGQQSLDFDNLMLENGYSGNRAYCQSKLAQILFTVELAERLGDAGITVNALHPATYMDTNMVHEAGISPANSVQKGAEAVEYVATSRELEDVTGEFFNVKQRSRANSQAYDEEARKRLWEISEELTGIESTV
ncbi:SDR family oxidoreductase [Aliifodinibius sp. S!AR15-10]|uniref:SDR family oxidoreductase n=1 Tax=Aliifodinibius sp. S!AR15-10 TaxID=2950437 RepID=UPI00286790F6|nr:SDR family oxidoreductase [Aliifodinibius sp. S!AR15-10]MDR8391399.1 SDR family oxidoreductase [Aliifodinibius sp. S!AR15-10]